MSQETPAEAPAEGAVKPRTSKSKKPLIIALVAIVAGGGGAAYAMLRPATEASAPTRGLVAFDPFVVNLADPGGMRFVRVTMQVVTYSEPGAKAIAESTLTMKESRSAILEILSQQLAADLVKIEGKAALRRAIVARLSKVIKETKVVDVFFSEFVVQF
jgi:flagellar FliL protein